MSRYERVHTNIEVTPLDLSDAEESALKYLRAHAQADIDLGKENVRMPSAVRLGWKWGVVDTPVGLYALCTEGVGPDKPISDENPLEVEYFIEAYESDPEGSHFIPMFPACQSKLTLDELRPRATGEPVNLETWVRSFGARLESNYDGWRKLLEQAMTPRHEVNFDV